MRDAPPKPPEKPLPADCCEGGCDRCVFVVYAEELEHYQQALAEWRERQSAREAGDAPDEGVARRGRKHA